MNCKPGDIAIITKSANPINLGKIVTVVRGYGVSPTMEGRIEYGIGWAHHPGLALWVIRSTSSIISEDNKYTFDELPFPDRWLKPVSGLEDDDVMEVSKELELIN